MIYSFKQFQISIEQHEIIKVLLFAGILTEATIKVIYHQVLQHLTLRETTNY